MSCEASSEHSDPQAGQLDTVLENAPVILYGLDLEGRFTFSKGNGLAALGLKEGQVVGDSAFELYQGNPGAPDAIRNALNGEHTVFEAHFGGAYFVSRLTPVHDQAGAVRGVVGVSLDIGRQFRAEQALIERDEQLLQSQKMEAVGQLAGGIAHDFNNLLTAIIGYSDLVLDSDDCPFESVRQDVREIRRAAERAASLTRQILAFSRRQAMQPEVVSVNDVLMEMQPLLARTLGESIELDLAVDPELGLIEVDPHQLAQVILNLAINGRDAMSGRGRLTMETGMVELSEEFCRLHLGFRPGTHVVLTVKDNGVGMDAETMSHMFEPFFTTKAQGEGTGLGLSTVYGVVRQSGGMILAESELDKGASFSVYFPCVDGTRDKSPLVFAPPAVDGAHEAILVVEDEPAVRALVTRVLASAGYIVFAAGDAAQALALLADGDCTVDLLLTDVVLPGGLQGDALARAVCATRPALRVIFMSGHPREALMSEGSIDRGVNYLQKPFTPDSLSRKVQEVLGATRR